MNRWIAIVPVLISTLAWAAAPPLTEEQAQQLGTAQDNSPVVDEAALFPLLQNALEWPAQGNEAFVALPDYQALVAAPEKYRGQMFLIEGWVGRVRKVGALARPGPWDGKLEQWAILLERGNPDKSVVVYVVNPPTELSVGRIDQEVRIPARFYKVWRSQSRNGSDMNYLTFVGSSVRTVAPPPPTTSFSPLSVIVAMLLVGGIAYLLLRMRYAGAARRPFSVDEIRERLGARRQEPQAEDQPEDPLPEDPAEALDELRNRHPDP